MTTPLGSARTSGRLLLVLAGFLLFTRPAGAQELDTPEAVARLELYTPARSHFLLHGTIPIPKGIFPRSDRKSPFAVLNHDPAGSLVPAQVEIVSRYPTGDADVVEIFAPVDLAPEDRPGEPVSFSIVPFESKPERAPKVTPAVLKLLSRRHPGTFGLRARDVYGNVYWADLSGNPDDPSFGSLRVLKSGRWVRERRVYATMVPIGATATPPTTPTSTPPTSPATTTPTTRRCAPPSAGPPRRETDLRSAATAQASYERTTNAAGPSAGCSSM
jgi:hypothetical protein